MAAVRGQQGNFTPMLLKMCDEVIFKFKDSLFSNQDDLFKKVSLKRFELLQVGLSALLDLIENKHLSTKQVLERHQ